VSEGGSPVPAPWVLDVSVLAEVARGGARIMTLIQELDARGRPLIIPVLAVTGASLDMRSDEAAELLEGLERLGNALVAPLRDAEQAISAAATAGRPCGRRRRCVGLPDPHPGRGEVAAALRRPGRPAAHHRDRRSGRAADCPGSSRHGRLAGAPPGVNRPGRQQC